MQEKNNEDKNGLAIYANPFFIPLSEKMSESSRKFPDIVQFEQLQRALGGRVIPLDVDFGSCLPTVPHHLLNFL
jgi:hypothetical protein